MAEPKGNSQPAATQEIGPEEIPAEPKRERDTWDYIEILARPAAAFITALAVAALGIIGNYALNDSNLAAQQRAKTAQKNELKRVRLEQSAAQTRAEMEQNTRLYTQLLSSREQADSNLRKDMFNTILGEFLSKSDVSKEKETDIVASTSDQLLKLELLALNFGDALSLRPLFQELNRSIESQAQKIKQSSGENDATLFEGIFLPRLKSLARRVSDRQASLLSAGGSTFTISINPKDAGASIDKSQVYEWPSDAAEANWKLGGKLSGEIRESWVQEEKEAMQKMSLEGIERAYEITLSNANYENSEVFVKLKIEDLSGDDISLRPLEMKFKLNFYNFPMIDNTRLSGDQRFALILKKFNQEEILIEGFCFPGSYASYRDKPFLNDAVEQLRISNRDSKAAISQE